MEYFFTGWMSYLFLETAEGFMGCFLQEAGKYMILDYIFVN